MINFLKRIQNIGIDSNTDLETIKLIRLINTLSLITIIDLLSVLIVSFFAGWPFEALMVMFFFFVSFFVPIVLNNFKKTAASSLYLVAMPYLIIFSFTIFFGLEFEFHYYMIFAMGMPIIMLPNRSLKLRLFLSSLGIFFFIYLEWHFTHFDSIIIIDTPYIFTLRLISNVILLVTVFILLYIIAIENEEQFIEIKKKTTSLEEKNIELEHFAYIASHDLNEPLRTVNSFVDIIQEEYEDPSDENLNIYFSFITDALSRMRLMIDGLLSYSRIGKSENFKTVDIRHLINEIQTDLSVLIKQKSVTIVANDLASINCLSLEVKQLFQNLITNAIKFQKPGKAPIIKINQKELPNFWQFCVADNGIGINSKKQTEIFQMFTKLHLPEEFEGHGIGLAFCKKIAEIHKGKIWVESSPGEGSQFYFTIQKN